MRIILVSLMVCMGLLSAAARDIYSVADVPNVHLQQRSAYVSDPEGLLDAEQTSALNAQLANLERTTLTQMAVVLLPSIGDQDPMQFAVDLGHTWGLGSKEGDNGVVLLLVMDTHSIQLQTGYGMEGHITDAESAHIVNDIIIPAMRDDDIYGALSGAVEEITMLTASPEVRQEMLAAKAREEAKEQAELRQAMINTTFIVMMVCAIWAMWIVIATGRKSRRIKRDNYQKAMLWRSKLLLTGILTLLSFLAALPLFLITLYKYRHWRTRRIVCPNCSGKMHRLNEEEDNVYLTHGQDVEERLGTVDYDVWLCGKCGTLERFPFYAKQTKYTACPTCGAIAYGTDSERILRKPTSSSAGEGERIKRCRSCGRTDSERFRIAPDDDSSVAGAFIAGAALGALSRGGGGGGGGSWSGGGFGGGGAGGHW